MVTFSVITEASTCDRLFTKSSHSEESWNEEYFELQIMQMYFDKVRDKNIERNISHLI